jgi:hypothetical protein
MEIVKVYSTPFNLDNKDEEELLGVFFGLESYLACRDDLESITCDRDTYIRRVWLNEGDEEHTALLGLEKKDSSREDLSEKKVAMLSPFEETTEKKFIASRKGNYCAFRVGFSLQENFEYIVDAPNSDKAHEIASEQLEKDCKRAYDWCGNDYVQEIGLNEV